MPDVLEAREWKERKRLRRGRPADSEVPSQVSKDGRIQQKDSAQQQVKKSVGTPACNARQKRQE